MSPRVYRLIIWPEAEKGVSEAAHWYEAQERGLGREFLRAFRAATAVLRRTPLHYQPIEEEARRVLLRRFPYGVFFEVHDFDVAILGCLHTARDPKSGEGESPVPDRDLQAARGVALALGITRVETKRDPSLLLEVTVILGTDWKAPAPNR